VTLLALTPGLTAPLGERFEQNVRRTHNGMAHFAGTGPDRATCHSCAHWGGAEKAAAVKLDLSGLKPATCAKFRALTGKLGQKIPHDAAACKYWEAYRP
jgi:hypothetical protein